MADRKTLPGGTAAADAALRSHHSYEVPQITMRTERCLNDYAKWIKQQVQL
jgi:periplasmic divalent cation tolerance protein